MLNQLQGSFRVSKEAPFIHQLWLCWVDQSKLVCVGGRIELLDGYLPDESELLVVPESTRAGEVSPHIFLVVLADCSLPS